MCHFLAVQHSALKKMQTSNCYHATHLYMYIDRIFRIRTTSQRPQSQQHKFCRLLAVNLRTVFLHFLTEFVTLTCTHQQSPFKCNNVRRF